MLKSFVQNASKLKHLRYKSTMNENSNKILSYESEVSKVKKDFMKKVKIEETKELKERNKKNLESKPQKIQVEKKTKDQETLLLTREMLKEKLEREEREDIKKEKRNLNQEQRINFDKHLPLLKEIKYHNAEDQEEKAEKRRRFQINHVVQILHEFHSQENPMVIDKFVHLYLKKHREIENRKNRFRFYFLNLEFQSPMTCTT
jgi:hypothetical protein